MYVCRPCGIHSIFQRDCPECGGPLTADHYDEADNPPARPGVDE